MHSSVDLPTAFVFSCRGASIGDLNLLRSLGREGVRVTLISEYDTAPALHSRYASKFILLPGFTREPDLLRYFFAARARASTDRPVIIANCDSDLALLSQLRCDLEADYRVLIPSASLIDKLGDKRQFATFAREHRLPVPLTHSPATLSELASYSADRFPLVIKPAHPRAWPDELSEHFAQKGKVLIAANADELMRMGGELIARALPFVVQEYIAGGDDEHIDVQVFSDASAQPVAWFSGRKIRTWPPRAGSGCYVRSEYVADAVDIAIDVLRRIGYVGLADLDFKRDSSTGKLALLEINPRIGQWHILASQSGVNLPYLAYCEAIGRPLPAFTRQREGLRYLHLANDLRSFRIYRRSGQWTLASYVRSLFAGDTIYQTATRDDIGPLKHAFVSGLRDVWTRVRGAQLSNEVA